MYNSAGKFSTNVETLLLNNFPLKSRGGFASSSIESGGFAPSSIVPLILSGKIRYLYVLWVLQKKRKKKKKNSNYASFQYQNFEFRFWAFIFNDQFG